MSNTNILRKIPFIPRPDDDTMLWVVKDITEESTDKYKVIWDGIDPDTGKPWEPSWVSKSDCTDQAVAQWEAKKGNVKSQNAGTRNTRSTSCSKNEQQAGPVEKRKRQCEDTQDEDWLPDTSLKSKKRAPRIPARKANAHHSPIVLLPPSIKIGPPCGAKRNEPIANNASLSASIQKSSQAIPKTQSLAQSSKAGSFPMDPILLRREEEEGSSEDDLHGSQDAPPISSVVNPDGNKRQDDTSGGSHLLPRALKSQEVLPTSKSTKITPSHPEPSSESSSSLLQKIKKVKELQFGISMASSITLKLALENAPPPGPLPNIEEIQRLQCEIGIASNTTLKLVLEAMEILRREY